MGAVASTSPSKDAEFARVRSLKSFGLHCIRECDADTVIVFVHGILSNGEEAWGSPSWPDLLAAEPELNGAGIFVFTYLTGLWSEVDPGNRTKR
jgi:hypothetical protein